MNAERATRPIVGHRPIQRPTVVERDLEK